jgi:hypothetical protein
MTNEPDFRSRTCGECAHIRLINKKEYPQPKTKTCCIETVLWFNREHPSHTMPEVRRIIKMTTPACPAFVPREKP